MRERRFIYYMGIIKWINLMTLFILMSNFFASLGLPTNFAIIFQLILVAIISISINKWFEKKFGKENLVENTLAFKIINGLIIFSIAVYLLINKMYLYLGIILIYMILFSLLLIIINKSKKQRKGRPV